MAQDLKTLMKDLRKEVSCTICLNLFTDPKQLPCLHSFCLHCLNELLRNSRRHDVITCPICKRVSRVPASENLNDLPTAFYINSMLDALAIKECKTSDVKCGNCDKKSSRLSYCFQCCTFWCNDCIPGHNIFRANNDHRVLALKDFRDEDFEDVLKRPVFCRKEHHGNKALELYCTNCEVAACITCVPTLHSGHDMVPLEKAAQEQKLQVKSVIKTLKQKAQQKRNEIVDLDEDSAQIQKQAADVKTDVERFADKMISIILARKQDIFSAVENQVKESLERLAVRKDEIENQVKVIGTAVKETETLLKRSTSAEIVQLKKSSEAISDEVERKSGKRNPEGLQYFTFLENQTMTVTMNTGGIGLLTRVSDTNPNQSSAKGNGLNEAVVGLEAQFVLNTRNAQSRQCHNELDRVTVEVTNQEGHDCVTQKRIKDNKDGTYKISYFVKEAGKCEAVVKVNGEHVHGSPCAVQVKSRVFQPVLSFGQKGSSDAFFDKPWGVAVNDRDEIAVTDCLNSRVRIFMSDGTPLRSFGRHGSGDVEFNLPTGIVYHLNSNIFVSDGHNHRIQIVSERGQYVGQFGGEGNLDHQLYFPCGLSVDSDWNILVADTGNKQIKIFSPRGEILQKIGGCFTRPIHCIQYGRYLMVSDYSVHFIKVFDRKGSFLHKFGGQGEEDGKFNSPNCLSVTKSDHLMVCDELNNRAQVFELLENTHEEKFVAKFGMKGSKEGEFRSPLCVAVQSNGRIVVSDWGNQRIQIFA